MVLFILPYMTFRHPVEYMAFKEHMMYTANIPVDKIPESDGFDSIYHRRYFCYIVTSYYHLTGHIHGYYLWCLIAYLMMMMMLM